MFVTDETKQMIINSYRVTFDKATAYMQPGLTKDDISFLEKDQIFQENLFFYLVQERERILTVLKNLSESVTAKDEIRLKATIELGKVIWPEMFQPRDKTILLTEKPEEEVVDDKALVDDTDHTATVLEILSKNGAFKPRAKDNAQGKAH